MATAPAPVELADVERLADALVRIAECQEPAELIYNTSRPLPTEASRAASAAAGNTPLEDESIAVACRISTLVGRLNELSHAEKQRVLTPRAILLELMDIIQHGLVMSLPPSMRDAGRERAMLVASFRACISSRLVPVEAMLEGLHALTYVSVKLRVELVTLQLRHRLKEEMAAAVDAAAAAVTDVESAAAGERMAALLVTETLLRDFTFTYDNTLLAIPIVLSAARATLGMTAEGSGSVAGVTGGGQALSPGETNLSLTGPDAIASLLPSLRRYYYHLGDWTLLTASAAEQSSNTLTRISRVRLDDRSGTAEVELHRPHTDMPWGLLLNARGELVGTDASMRVGRHADALHELLRSTEDGARIAAVNGIPVRSTKQQSHAAASAVVVEALQQASHRRKWLRLQLTAPQLKAKARQGPVQLLFSLPAQGGEGASGQRAALLLQRVSLHAQWQFAVGSDLTWYPPPPQLLSEGVRRFVLSFPYRLRLFAVNGVEVQSAAQVRDLAEDVEVLVLELVVASVSDSVASGRVAGHGASVATQRVAELPAGEIDSAGRARHAEVVTAKAAPRKIPKGRSGASLAPPSDPVTLSATAVTIERQVREATQRLLLSHAQKDELRESPLVAEVADGDGDEMAGGDGVVEEVVDAVVEAEATAELGGEAAWRHAPDEAEPAGAVDEKEPDVGSDELQASEEKLVEEQNIDADAEHILEEVLRRAGVSTGSSESPMKLDQPPSKTTIKPSRARSGGTRSKAPANAAVNRAAVTSSSKKAGAHLPQSEGAACLFANQVRLLSFDGSNMQFQRDSTSSPWGIKITQSEDSRNTDSNGAVLPLRVLSLPEPLPACARHPFLRQFKKGNPQWLIESINGKSAATAAVKTLGRMRKATKMSMKLLRK